MHSAREHKCSHPRTNFNGRSGVGGGGGGKRRGNHTLGQECTAHRMWNTTQIVNSSQNVEHYTDSEQLTECGTLQG